MWQSFSFAFYLILRYNTYMKQWVIIYVFLGIALMPFSAYSADEGGIIGQNLWLDFYSRIDDAGDKVAQAIVSRRLTEKWTYKSLGCNANWLNNQKINQSLLEELRIGQLTSLNKIIANEKVRLSTDQLSQVSQCLVEKYDEIRKAGYQDQNILEEVGNIGLYMDGDTNNSDYDILSDITRINGIIFKEKYDYTGTKNWAAKSVASMMAGNPIAPLFPASSFGSSSASGSTAPGAWADPSNGGSSSNGSNGSNTTLPWAWVCSVWSNNGSSTGTNSLFGDDFFDDLGSVIWWGSPSTWMELTPIPSIGNNGTGGSDVNTFGLSEGSDFFHTPPCDGIFCITVDMQWGSSNLLGGFANTSIESLLEKHSKMMEPISWSDLSAQKMTNNSYQPPWLNMKIKDKIAWARVYMTDSIQPTRKLESEESKEKTDAVFDAAFKCAMNEAWLPGDPLLANGFIGAGFVPKKWQTTNNVLLTSTPLGPKEMDNLSGCYGIRIGKWKEESYKSLSTDLNEIQWFTQAMMGIILQILETDKKLDKLPSK
jgi:hypothetical protein